MLKDFHGLKVKIFADGADLTSMIQLANLPWIKGLTTNPTLMRQAGIADYRVFAKKVLQEIKAKPISFEVFSDDFAEMERQALEIADWGENVYVKIPVSNTKGQFTGELIDRLSHQGVKLNVTAIMVPEDVVRTCAALRGGAPSYVSVFAGRIADAGLNPLPLMQAALAEVKKIPGCELIWASPRELYNIVQAHDIGCDIITVTPDLLKKLPTIGKDLATFSQDTVKMFYNDAQAAGFQL
jgi:transaldolase